jgi:hypothetical protein
MRSEHGNNATKQGNEASKGDFSEKAPHLENVTPTRSGKARQRAENLAHKTSESAR